MRYLAACALALPPIIAQAGDVYLHGLTTHYVACEEPCNETNIGLSYKHDLGDNFVHVGAFENSQYNPSAFAVYGWSREWKGIEFGVGVGATVGYVDKMGWGDAGVLPIGIVSAQYGPVYAAVIPGAVTLAWEIE